MNHRRVRSSEDFDLEQYHLNDHVHQRLVAEILWIEEFFSPQKWVSPIKSCPTFSEKNGYV
jgi:hypothetical protein